MAKYPRMAVRLGSYEAGSSVTVSDCVFRDSDSVNTLYLYADTIDVRGNQFLDQGGPVAKTSPHDASTVYLSTTTEHGRQSTVGNTFRGVLGSPGARTAIETHGGAQVVTDNAISSYAAGMNLTGINSSFSTRSIDCSGNTLSNVLIGLHVWARYSGAVKHGATLKDVVLSDNTITIDRDAWSWIRGVSAYGYGVLVDPTNDAPIDGLTVSSNAIRFLASSSKPSKTDRHSTGINIELASPTAEVRDFRIVSNTITDPSTAGAILSGAMKRGIVTGNTVFDPARSAGASLVAVYKSGWALGGVMEEVTFENNRVIDTSRTRPDASEAAPGH
jgi:hypothetical protein